jgi:alpha-glucosidase
MRIKKAFVAFFLLLCPAVLFAQKKVTVSSPSKELSFSFRTEEGHPEYSVSYKGKALIQSSRLGLAFAENNVFGDNIDAGTRR